MIFMGIDPGLDPAVCVFKRNKPKVWRIYTPVEKEHKNAWYRDMMRLESLQIAMRRLLEEYDPNNLVFALEGVSFGESFGVALSSKVDFIMKRMMLNSSPKFYYVIPPTTVKKLVLGNGKATKSDIAAWVYDMYGLNVGKDYNLSDAVAIAEAGKRMYYARSATDRSNTGNNKSR